MTAFSPGQSPPPVRTPTRMRLPPICPVPQTRSLPQCPARQTSPMSVIAIDAGTTGVTSVVVGADGAVASRGYAEFGQLYPQPGWVEQLPEAIWQATLASCARALDGLAARHGAADPVTCLGLTNQRETAVIWDRATLATPRDRLAGSPHRRPVRAAARGRA